jgi:hypothetical protein
MAGTVALVPVLSAGRQPVYPVIAAVGLAMIALSSVFLAVARRVLGLRGAWLGLALLTNGLVLGAKFIAIPLAFSETTFVVGSALMDVRAPGFFPGLGAALLLLDVLVAVLVYAVNRARPAAGRRSTTPLSYVVVLGAGVWVAGASLVVVLGLAVTWTGVYSVTTLGLLLIPLSALALTAAGATLWHAGETAVSLSGTAALTSALWLTLSLLLVYHVVWVVFMGVLVSLWPLKVITPSGK